MINSAITFDIDWAPDWSIALCRDICSKRGVPATFFATHESPLLSELLNDARFEVGIHPNFLPRSSQGATVEDVIAYCMKIVPSARSMRTHGLMQWTGLFQVIQRIAPSITFDVSLFLPNHPDLRPFAFYVGDDKPIIRVPYFWEDDIASVTPAWSWDSDPQPSAGLRIFDFHPIHVALNMVSMRQYRQLKDKLGSLRMDELTEEAIRPLINDAKGTQTFLERAIECIGPSHFGTVASVATQHFRE
jgi:hypothetical protein